MGRPLTRDYRELTDVKIARWFTEPGLHCVGGNLYVNVTNNLSRSWIFRYLAGGRRRDMGLGPVELVTLDQARAAALECRKLRAQGGDPLERRRQVEAAAAIERAKRKPFAECFEAYFAAFSPEWSASHAKRVHANITTYALPILGKLPASSIDTQLILQVLAMWNDKTELARKLRGWLEQILDFATTRGMREATPNPARWDGHLEHLLARPSRIAKVTHHKALPWPEIPAFFAAVRASAGVVARAMELITLTACRKDEGLGALWGEFDLAQRMWTIPVERLKTRRNPNARPHRIPLSAAALDLLDRQRRELGAEPLPQAPLFIWRGKRLNDGAPDKLLKKIGFFDRMTTHGLRSTHTDFATENLDVPSEVREMALAHKVADDVALAYMRTDMFERRRNLAEAWACWCQGRSIDPRVLILDAPAAQIA